MEYFGRGFAFYFVKSVLAVGGLIYGGKAISYSITLKNYSWWQILLIIAGSAVVFVFTIGVLKALGENTDIITPKQKKYEMIGCSIGSVLGILFMVWALILHE